MNNIRVSSNLESNQLKSYNVKFKKNPSKYTFRRFFQQNYPSTQPRHFSLQHIGD
jgi:hypothetical protein